MINESAKPEVQGGDFIHMLLYNQITEITATQFLTIVLFEILMIVVNVFVFKKKLTLKILLYSAIIAATLSLLSIVIVRGNFGGTAYYEKFGWPLQYHIVSRNIEIGTNIAVPHSFHFDLFRFIANAFFWWFTPLIALNIIFNGTNKKQYKLFLTSAILFFILLTVYFSYSNFKKEKSLIIKDGSTLTIPTSNGDGNIISKDKNAIESAYPEFKRFEDQKSFAGQKIKSTEDEFDRYYAYMVLGSGVPIAAATCFRVDRLGQVFKIGIFPDPLDSYVGYRDIDPRNCRGIK